MQDAVIMLLGAIMLSVANGTTINGWVIMYAISQLVYGVGVGGNVYYVLYIPSCLTGCCFLCRTPCPLSSPPPLSALWSCRLLFGVSREPLTCPVNNPTALSGTPCQTLLHAFSKIQIMACQS